jgi:hypothetical protein
MDSKTLNKETDKVLVSLKVIVRNAFVHEEAPMLTMEKIKKVIIDFRDEIFYG